jgi:hypothetical protein
MPGKPLPAGEIGLDGLTEDWAAVKRTPDQTGLSRAVTENQGYPHDVRVKVSRRARSTCLRERLRSAKIAVSCSRSVALNTTHTSCAMVPIPPTMAQYCTSSGFMNPLYESEH